MARQLHVPWSLLAQMAYTLFKNGLFGSIPFAGDAYSFYLKRNAVNAAPHSSCRQTRGRRRLFPDDSLIDDSGRDRPRSTNSSDHCAGHPCEFLVLGSRTFRTSPSLCPISSSAGRDKKRIAFGWRLIESRQTLPSFHESGRHGGGNFPRSSERCVPSSAHSMVSSE